jgi:hypothetical protein
MNWEQFIAIPNGQRVFNNGWDQCVALANLYHQEVIGAAFVPVASAYQWYTDFSRYLQLTNNYVQLPAHANPEAGDIFVSRGGMYNYQDGHIGVVVSSWNGGTFGTKEQNAELNRYVYQTYNRTKSNMLGYLRPKNNPAANKPKVLDGENDMLVVMHKERGIYFAVGQQYLYRYSFAGHAQVMAQKINPDRSVIVVNDTGGAANNEMAAWALLKTYNISGDVWMKLQPDQTWSAVSSIDSGSGNTNAISQAVNDEMARRLAQ